MFSLPKQLHASTWLQVSTHTTSPVNFKPHFSELGPSDPLDISTWMSKRCLRFDSFKPNVLSPQTRSLLNVSFLGWHSSLHLHHHCLHPSCHFFWPTPVVSKVGVCIPMDVQDSSLEYRKTIKLLFMVFFFNLNKIKILSLPHLYIQHSTGALPQSKHHMVMSHSHRKHLEEVGKLHNVLGFTEGPARTHSFGVLQFACVWLNGLMDNFFSGFN